MDREEHMILATGAGGMLGSYLDDSRVLKTDIDTLDVTQTDQIEAALDRFRPRVVLHLAAETDVDKCEIEIDHAYRVNALGTENVALACQRRDLPLLYVSTAGVFDGEKPEPYSEFDPPNPVNVYGCTKWEGEKIVQQLLTRYYIVRAGWMVGGLEKDKKFVGKIVRLLKERDNLKVVNDKFGSPTYAADLADVILRLVDTDRYGLYHATCKGVCSRYDVAVEIARLLGRDVEIGGISSAAFPLPAHRARSEAMRNMKFELLGWNWMRPWQEALAEYLRQWQERGLI